MEPAVGEPVFIRPEVFLEHLRQNVVAQVELLPKLAAAFSRYTAFLVNPAVGKPVPLIYGPSGGGKSFSVEQCAQLSGLPVTVTGAGEVSPPGYKGVTLRDMLTAHYLRAGFQDHGVVFVDEIDKCCLGAMQQGQAGQRVDPEARHIGLSKQFELLRYVERQLIEFVDEGKDIEELEGHQLDTGRLMWVFAGAFSGLDHLIKHRTGQEQVSTEDIWENADPVDFIKYGMVYEFAYRISEYGWVRRLTAPEIMRVLQQQDRARWVALFTMIDCELDLQDGALAAAATLADQQQSGPRGARVWFTRTMDDVFTTASELRLGHVTVDARTMHSGHLDIRPRVA